MSKYNCKSDPKERYLAERYDILSQFCMDVTPEMINHMEDLYPNEIAIENYSKSLIKTHLGED